MSLNSIAQISLYIYYIYIISLGPFSLYCRLLHPGRKIRYLYASLIETIIGSDNGFPRLWWKAFIGRTTGLLSIWELEYTREYWRKVVGNLIWKRKVLIHQNAFGNQVGVWSARFAHWSKGPLGCFARDVSKQLLITLCACFLLSDTYDTMAWWSVSFH